MQILSCTAARDDNSALWQRYHVNCIEIRFLFYEVALVSELWGSTSFSLCWIDRNVHRPGNPILDPLLASGRYFIGNFRRLAKIEIVLSRSFSEDHNFGEPKWKRFMRVWIFTEDPSCEHWRSVLWWNIFWCDNDIMIMLIIQTWTDLLVSRFSNLI